MIRDEYKIIVNIKKEIEQNIIFEYNHLRRHRGLNYETPFDKLPKVTELVSRYKRLLLFLLERFDEFQGHKKQNRDIRRPRLASHFVADLIAGLGSFVQEKNSKQVFAHTGKFDA